MATKAAARLARSGARAARRSLRSSSARSPTSFSSSCAVAAPSYSALCLSTFSDSGPSPSTISVGLLRRGFHSTAPSALSYSASPQQISESEFTQMAFEGISGAVQAAQQSKQQVVESEHLMKALLEQKDGLGRRIFAKAGIDNTSALQATDQFISQQPKVAGSTSGPIIGSSFGPLLDNARKYKKEFNDEYLSVEHLILAFLFDKRFGVKFFQDLGISEKELKDAIMAIRGSQRVTDPSKDASPLVDNYL